MIFNTEGLHAAWMDNFCAYALKWGGEKKSTGLLLAVDGNYDELYFKSLGEIALPGTSLALATDMAKFSRKHMPKEEGHLPNEWQYRRAEVFNGMFWLPSLLVAAYPRDVKTGRFGGNDGSDADPEDGLCQDGLESNVAFAGLGIILMRGCRQLLDPLLTDEMVVNEASEKQLYLSIIEKEDQIDSGF